MPEQCTNCGSELFVGQRFCRACGASTDDLSQERVPTRMMPPQPDDWGARSGANTAPTYRPDTNPVYAPPTGYQPSVPSMPPQVIPPYTPPRSRSRLGWILAALGMGLFVAVVIAIMIMARIGRRTFNSRDQQPPPVITAQPGETPLNESSADQVVNVDNESTFTKSFALDRDAKFSIKNINGSIVIQAWDQPRAEVKIIKQGGDRGGQVFYSGGKGNLSFRTAQRGGPEVRYEVKLPKDIGRVTLDTANGAVKMTGITGQIFIQGANGAIELTDVTGVSKVQTANGKIKAVLEEASDGPMEFAAANGSIDITIKSDFAADLEATTVHGGINLDDSFGISVTREIVGQRARGQIGRGGQVLKITTMNGSIRVGKQ